jgi:HK97 family phage prohead protease
MANNFYDKIRLSSDAIGLKFEVDPPDTQVARDLMTMVERGDVSQCSFSFQCIEDSWNEDRQGLVRTLKKVVLYDVSAVTYPAYPDTDVAMRRFHELDEYYRQRERKIRLAGL